jgi:hypothetical protein
MAAMPFLAKLRGFVPGVNGFLQRLVRAKTASWRKPIILNPAVRHERHAGRKPGGSLKRLPHNCLKVHPKGELRSRWKVRQRRLFGRTYSAELPDLELSDWPPETRAIGFPFYDQRDTGSILTWNWTAFWMLVRLP